MVDWYGGSEISQVYLGLVFLGDLIIVAGHGLAKTIS